MAERHFSRHRLIAFQMAAQSRWGFAVVLMMWGQPGALGNAPRHSHGAAPVADPSHSRCPVLFEGHLLGAEGSSSFLGCDLERKEWVGIYSPHTASVGGPNLSG